ncbi:formamidopyrimidine-DNA glycosylase-like isoform X1 [Pistacia vera]|uniref:formamidopyrimidine-DNA glycosylase-like isoform X1 n=1 Tax=Pistacia vera TaxID=55513 RepID=UPI0012637568|nr:formamidopyrimidine-DNA glycosylase-like isoform X1 [Pistacia vera]
MPELPEVEAARRAIEENCVGKKIVKLIIADDPKVIDGVSASEFEASLLGKTIVSAHRKGKNMWLRLDSPPFPSFQFGMAGAVYIKGVAVTKYKRSAVKDTDEWPSKYSKFFVELDDGLEMSFTDKRRFAKVRLLKDPASVAPISDLGPDALLEPLTVDEFTKSLSKKKIAIKALLLDQSFISGIGNWVADEVLYQARIHPLQISAGLSKESCATLLKCIKEVIEKAIEVGADSSQFPNNWIFHSREKKPGKAFVDGKKIDFITVGGRTTAYVPELQKLNGVQSAKAVVKQKKQTSKRKGSEDDGGDNGVDAPESAVEEVTENVKSKRGRKPGGQGAKPSKKRKSKESDDDDSEHHAGDDDDDADELQAGDDDDDADELQETKSGKADELQETKSGKATKNKQAKAVKTSKEKFTSQKSKNQKKKAK